MKGLIGRKLGMSQIYTATGHLVPVTVIEAGPCPILAVRTVAKDRYAALQLGFGLRKAKNVSKAVRGHLAAAKLSDTPPAAIREIRLAADPTAAVGDAVKADIFAANEFVDVIGVTKGRGFQGAVRRWHFAGGRASHGGGWVRRTGSIGMKARPGRVLRGHRMPGHMGHVRRTAQNLTVAAVDAAENLLLIKGSVPGPNGEIVIIRGARKKQ